MERPVKLSKGFTIIEALVALVILAIFLLGLLAGLVTAMRYNILNYLRDEAKLLALECAENIKGTSFTSIVDGTVDCNAPNPVLTDIPCSNIGDKVLASQPEKVRRQIRNTNVNYRIGWIVTTSGNVHQIQIQVCWTYGGKSYTHTVTTLVSRGTLPSGGP